MSIATLPSYGILIEAKVESSISTTNSQNIWQRENGAISASTITKRMTVPVTADAR